MNETSSVQDMLTRETLDEASLPALVGSLVLLTGDMKLLERWDRSPPPFLGDVNAGFTAEQKDEICSEALRILADGATSSAKGRPLPSREDLRKIMSWVADRSDRTALHATPWSRIELANLGDLPRCLVWNYGPHFRGEATKIIPIGPAFEPDRWYHVRFVWAYRAPTGFVRIHVDDRSYSTTFTFVNGTVGPGRFFLFGHVGTTRPEGRTGAAGIRHRAASTASGAAAA